MLRFLYGQESPERFARRHFGGTRLRDRRRSERAVAIARAMASEPGASIPTMMGSHYAIKATYNLFNHPQATPDNLQADHRDLVREQLRKPGQTYLLIEDSSELTWSGNQPVEGLGASGVGAKGLQGFKLHSVLAARWPLPAKGSTGAKRPPLELLGLVDQQYHVRQGRPKGESRNIGSNQRRRRPRESQLWTRATERVGPAPADARWVRVCDREADIYEFVLNLRQAGHGYVIRAAQNRVLLDGGGRAGKLKLLDHARSLQPFEQALELELRARPQHKARVAQLKLAAGAVQIQAPQMPDHRAGWGEPVDCHVVRVFEPHPPEGQTAVEWILLTDQAVEDVEMARETVLQYSARWIIEEFHKGLKTGLGAERLQLETAERLFAAIAIMSVVALRLIDLRERLRIDPKAPAQQSGLSDLELKLLRAKLKRKIETVEEVGLAIGRLGGHMNRRNDGPPGWKTLWLGMKKLHLIVQGYLLYEEVHRSG